MLSYTISKLVHLFETVYVHIQPNISEKFTLGFFFRRKFELLQKVAG